MTDTGAMQAALDLARACQAAGEVPVAAIIVRNGEILATGENRVLRDADSTAHAEIVALRRAGVALKNYRLDGCTLYCTLEPCAMCAGAILHARIDRLVYAAADPKAGACGSVLGVMNHPQLNHRVTVEAGLLADECGAMLSSFFRARRNNAKAPPRILLRMAAKKKSTKKRWSAKVTTDSTHPGPGLFKKSGKEIADALAKKSVSPGGPGQGMRMLNFYENRGGKNLSKERKAALDTAKKLLHKKVERAKKTRTKKAATKKSAKKSIRKRNS